MAVPAAQEHTQTTTVQRRGLARWPATTRLLAALVTAGAALAVPGRAWWAQGVLALFLLVVGGASGVAPGKLIKRLIPLALAGVICLPLALIPGSKAAETVVVAGLTFSKTTLAALWSLYSKSALVVLGVSMFAALMTGREALQAATDLRVPRMPKVLVWLASAWVGNLQDAVRRRRLAIQARGVGRGWSRFRTAAHASRALIWDGLRLTDTLSCALVARGFHGDVVVLPGEGAASRLPFSFLLYLGLLAGLVYLSFR